ncbi:MAG: ribosome maturation factor RimM, partial [Anaerolineae bacterium]|nr:ribosome maturation factor RimM [Anaerolineae bacterium]
MTVGQLGKPHGVRGEITLNVFTDFPDRLEPDVVVYVGNHQKPLRILRARPTASKMLLTFEGIETREQAGEI